MVAGNLFSYVGLKVQLQSPDMPFNGLNGTFYKPVGLGASDGRGFMDGPPHGLLPTRLATQRVNGRAIGLLHL